MMKLIDSHCHLDRIDLEPYQGDFALFMQASRQQGLKHMLCVCINLDDYPAMLALVEAYDDISISVGVHPCEPPDAMFDMDELVRLAQHPKNVAIGETGLDYYRTEEHSLAWQRERFRQHIAAAKIAHKPLIIHTREARQDTIDIMREEKIADEGGVMHCFTETWDMARAALDMHCYISFSGILTFKNAHELRLVAEKTPMDRILIETDSPYLAPAPYRGKSNEPQYVIKVAEKLAEIKKLDLEQVIQQTQDNYYTLFGSPTTSC